MQAIIAIDKAKVRKLSFQEKFPLNTKCCYCGATSRLAFVAHEMDNEGDSEEYVCQLYPNEPENNGLWLHDAVAVAVYFCKGCLRPTALYNQA